jgi:23S rRNA pseudouridine1911/1915/1917 synthase
MTEIVVESAERLDKFLAEQYPEHSRSKLVRLIDDGSVLVNGKVAKASLKLKLDDVVSVPEIEDRDPHDLTPADIPLEVLFEDEHLLVVNKPRGLASHPAASLKEPSLVNALLARGGSLSTAGGEFRPGIVHRLDKETTGLMVVAKTDSAHVALAKQIEAKGAERRYFAVVAGEVERERFVIDAPIARNKSNRQLMAVDNSGKRAVTHVVKVARIEQGNVIACRLETGRTHQIRVHLRAIGNPVLGDQLYAPREWASGVMQLHAAFLAFDHPVTGERVVTFQAPPEGFFGAEFCTRSVIESV